jgi:hypothetical protein
LITIAARRRSSVTSPGEEMKMLIRRSAMIGVYGLPALPNPPADITKLLPRKPAGGNLNWPGFVTEPHKPP